MCCADNGTVGSLQRSFLCTKVSLRYLKIGHRNAWIAMLIITTLHSESDESLGFAVSKHSVGVACDPPDRHCTPTSEERPYFILCPQRSGRDADYVTRGRSRVMGDLKALSSRADSFRRRSTLVPVRHGVQPKSSHGSWSMISRHDTIIGGNPISLLMEIPMMIVIALLLSYPYPSL